MELKKFNPWNWFKKEEKEDSALAVRTTDGYSHPVLQLHREFDRLFDQMLRGFSLAAAEPTLGRPKVDISETDAEYQLELELPGVELKDVELSVNNGVLLVRGEKKSSQESKQRNTHRIERYYGSFQRMFSLPEDCDEEKIEAHFHNGVLRIDIGRKAAAALPSARTIPIKDSEPLRR